jgi:PilZ domain
MRAEPNSNIRQLRRAAGIVEGRRIGARLPARIKVGTSRAACLVTDVSSSGACLSLDGPLDQNTKLWLIMDNLPPVSATAAWRKRNRVGLRFDKEQDWVHRVHKDRFAPIAGSQERSGLN